MSRTNPGADLIDKANGEMAHQVKVLAPVMSRALGLEDAGTGEMPRPFAKWTDGGIEEFYRGRIEALDGEEREPAGRARIRARLNSEKALITLLGAPVYKDTTVLIAKHGEWIGECVVDRVKQKWSLWTPHRRLAVDFFPKERDIPAQHVLEAKKTFADEHKFRYVIVPPGHGFGFDDINALIGETNG